MTEALKPPRRPLSERLFGFVLWGGMVVLLVVSFGPAEIWRFPMLFTQSENMRQFGQDFLRPDFAGWRIYAAQMWLTLQIALWGTVLALVIAIPAGLAGARNIAPDWVRRPVRWAMDILRSVPDLVIGTLFLVAVGLSPFAGVMALALHTGGVLGKLFSEAVEAIEPGPVEGVRATGAGPLQEIVWGVVPQVAPLWTSYGLYRFESNARAATILGLIGAGGIGQVLFEALNSFAYDQVAAIALVIVIAVSGIDLLSQAIRQRLI
ncbi:MAG TPA: phosphonate ABC transporter, permease protein PhnE [Caulobacteraceae bacterium]|nr:phosphonate ABC transporter, permease protein PhnE [Caulobacteraceae bacterium]